MTLKEIVDDLDAQLAWRGPGGKPQGHVVIPRSEAQELLQYTKAMLSTLVELSDPLTIKREPIGPSITNAMDLILTMGRRAKQTLRDVGAIEAAAPVGDTPASAAPAAGTKSAP